MYNKELLAVTPLDGTMDQYISKKVSTLPLDFFDDTMSVNILKSIQNGQGMQSLTDSELTFVAELTTSEEYQLFKNLPQEQKVIYLKGSLDNYKKVKTTGFLEVFNQAVLESPEKFDKHLSVLNKNIARLPRIDEPKSVKQAFDKVLEQAVDYLETGKSIIYPTRYESLNRCFGGGLRENDILVLTAGTGCGKTTFALNLLEDFSRNYPCFYNSLEMDSNVLMRKLLVQLATRRGRLNFNMKSVESPNRDDVAIINALQDSVYNMDIDFGCHPNIDDFLPMLYKKKYKFIFVDHLNMVTGNTDIAKFDEFVLGLKKYCIDEGAIAICLAQLRKSSVDSGSSSKTIKSYDDIKGSGQTKDAASQIITITKTEERNRVDLQCLKNRHEFGSGMNESTLMPFTNRNGQVFDEVVGYNH